MSELKFTVAELQIALSRVFSNLGYWKYRELSGGFGNISEEFWEDYERFAHILHDKIHPPFLEELIRLDPHALAAVPHRVESLSLVIFSDAGDEKLINAIREYDKNISRENIESYKANLSGDVSEYGELTVRLENDSTVTFPMQDWDFR